GSGILCAKSRVVRGVPPQGGEGVTMSASGGRSSDNNRMRLGVAVVFAAALMSCSSGGAKGTQPPSMTATVGPRRVYRVVVEGSTGPVGQDIHTLEPVNPPSGRPTYAARNLGPGCARCRITDLSPNAVFDAGGTRLTQKIVWRVASGDILRGNYVGHFM